MARHQAVRFLVLALAAAAVVASVSVSGQSAAPAPKRAPSLGPPPKKIDVQSCHGLVQGCVDDVWGGNFEIKVSPHVVRVGEVMTATVTDGTDAYGHSWTWGNTPIGATAIKCSPPLGTWTKAPSSGHCSYRMTASTAGWSAIGATVNPLGQSYTDEDYYAVLADSSLLHGHVRDADGKGIARARVGLVGPSGDLFATTSSTGYYDAILKKGIYTVSVSVGEGKVCATYLAPCANPTKVNLVTDKEVDFAEPEPLAIAGLVSDHRGKPLSGVVAEAGTKSRDTTGKDGSYEIKVSTGTYTVHPVLGGKTDRERYQPASKTVKVTSGKVQANFKLVAADEVSLTSKPEATNLQPGYQLHQGLWWTIAPPSGTWRVPVTGKVENGRGDPVADESLTVREPTWLVAPRAPESGPRAIVCDDVWQRLEPGAKRQTDDSGEIHFTVLTGTDIASFGLTVAESADAGFFDLGRFGQVGSIGSADPKPLLTGQVPRVGKLPPDSPSLAAAQQAGLNWLLAARYGTGTGGFGAGDFGPIRSADGKAGAIIFYPEHDPGPLRNYFAGTSSAALSIRYTTWVLPITQSPPVAGPWNVRPGELQSLSAWETAHGKPQAGYVAPHAGESLAYFGYPYPPPANSPERPRYDRCVPGAAP